jgi:ABC-type Na+ efflux pump permease subunit
MHAVLVLTAKDLRLHARGVVAYTLGFTVAAWVLLWLMPPLSGPNGPPAILFPIALYFVLICAGWLVERERSRETLALLRALPVSDLAIVGSKFLAYFVMQLFGFTVALLASPLVRLATPVQLISVFVVMYLFAALVLAVQLSFAGRSAAAGPLVLMVIATASGARIARSPELVVDAVRWWNEPWLHAAFWAGAVLVVLGLGSLAWLRIRSQDTQNLVG